MAPSVFEVTEENGFLPLIPPIRKLPEQYKQLDDLLENLPTYLKNPSPTNLADQVALLPVYPIKEPINNNNDKDQPTDPALVQALFRDYSILIAAYILEGKEKGLGPRTRVPRQLSVPFYALSKILDEPLIMSYDSYCLYNFYSTDGSKLWENLRLIRKFDGGMEEATFILIHSEIEYHTSALIKAYNLLIRAIEQNNIDNLKEGLKQLAAVQEKMIVSQLKMFNASDPKNYVRYVRPWIFGYKNNPDIPNGVIFEDVLDDEPQFLRGETGAQSTIIPSLDIVLGISHKNDPLGQMLTELEAYRPRPQRDYLNFLREKFWPGTSTTHREQQPDTNLLRSLASKDEEASLLFNRCVLNVFEFRSIHVAYADVYIARYTDKEEATGGTPYKAYLRKHRDESNQYQITAHPSSIINKPGLQWDTNNTQTLQELDKAENGIPTLLLNYYLPLIEKYGNSHPSLSKKQY